MISMSFIFLLLPVLSTELPTGLSTDSTTREHQKTISATNTKTVSFLTTRTLTTIVITSTHSPVIPTLEDESQDLEPFEPLARNPDSIANSGPNEWPVMAGMSEASPTEDSSVSGFNARDSSPTEGSLITVIIIVILCTIMLSFFIFIIVWWLCCATKEPNELEKRVRHIHSPQTGSANPKPKGGQHFGDIDSKLQLNVKVASLSHLNLKKKMENGQNGQVHSEEGLQKADNAKKTTKPELAHKEKHKKETKDKQKALDKLNNKKDKIGIKEDKKKKKNKDKKKELLSATKRT